MAAEGFTRRWGSFQPGKRWIGFEHSLVTHHGAKYLERWLLYVWGGTVRLHKFWKGDDDRAPHDHPWWFVTFPFHTYEEKVAEGSVMMHRTVKAFRFHYRPATYRHIVVGAAKPFFTLCISGQRSRDWGFWPSDKQFVYWRNWT